MVGHASAGVTIGLRRIERAHAHFRTASCGGLYASCLLNPASGTRSEEVHLIRKVSGNAEADTAPLSKGRTGPGSLVEMTPIASRESINGVRPLVACSPLVGGDTWQGWH